MTEDSLNTNDPKLKLFLRLPRDTFAATPSDEEFLKEELFRLLGETTADRFMPRISKGHCFLFFTTRLRAAQAHDKLSNKVVKDYPLQPVFGFTREEQQAVDAGLQNKEIERNHRTLYIRGLPGNIQSSQLEQQFSQFGEIEKTQVVATKNSQVAFLVFRKFAPAHEAINAYQDGFEIGGQTAIVELSKNKNLRRRVEKFQQSNMGMRGGFGPGGRNFGGRGGWGPPPFGGGRGYGGYGAPQWGSQNQWGGSRGYGGYRGGRGRGNDRGRGSYGGSRGRGGGFGGPRGGGYGGGRGASSGGYGGGRGSTGGGAYGGGRGAHSGGAYGGGRGGNSGGAYGGGNSGGYGNSRGGWGSQQRGGGRGGGSSGWQNKSFQPY